MDKYMNANIVFSKFSRDYMGLKKDLPIRPSEMGVLNIVTQQNGDFTPLILAEMMGVSKPMIAAHLQTLLKKGYIYKVVSPDDRRSFYVRPTEKGKILFDEFQVRQTKYLKNIEESLGESEFSELIRLLGETQNILEKIKEE